MTMIDSAESGRRLRCALFVDFDNVYIGLQRLDPKAAEAFASAPTHWLSALETGEDADGDFSRKFLIRACYLNPSVFSQFRPNFTRAGFSVVDCPSLTQQGKSSADINLVLDAVDALSAETRYDEFVILSADADFTPLALRCRAADRRVTIITAGPAASAYRAVADTVITADELAELVKNPDSAAQGEEPAPTAEKGRRSRRSSSPSTPAKTGESLKDVQNASAVDLPPLQRQVVDVTDIPNLPAERYRILLSTLADDVTAVPFDRPETSRRVRDACQAAGEPIGRASVNTVIAGVMYAGLDLAAKPTARKVAETWADNVIGLCRGARMQLGPQDLAAIRAWVGGGLLKS
jgi:NYN domain